jgi:type I restriction enzyme, S subunit
MSDHNRLPHVPLGGLCRYDNGGTPSKSESSYWDGDIPWITSTEVSDGTVSPARSRITKEGIRHSATKQVPAGTLLLVTRTGVGKVAIAPYALAFSQDITAIYPDGSKLEKRYLRRFLDTQEAYFERLSRGATIKGITRDVLNRLEIPLPPLPEQKRIADILDKADAIRRKRREISESLNRLRQALFLDMFGDPLHNPKGWPCVPLGKLVSPTRSITYGILKPGDNVPNGVPMLRIQDINAGVLRTTDLHRVSQELSHQYRRTILDGTELVISLVGTIGLVANVPASLKGANVHRNLGVIVPGSQIRRSYLHTMMNLPRCASLLRSSIKGGNQALLNLGSLDELELPVPPVELQDKYGERLEIISATADKATSAVNDTRSLFDSLVQRAFRGEL